MKTYEQLAEEFIRGDKRFTKGDEYLLGIAFKWLDEREGEKNTRICVNCGCSCFHAGEGTVIVDGCQLHDIAKPQEPKEEKTRETAEPTKCNHDWALTYDIIGVAHRFCKKCGCTCTDKTKCYLHKSKERNVVCKAGWQYVEYPHKPKKERKRFMCEVCKKTLKDYEAYRYGGVVACGNCTKFPKPKKIIKWEDIGRPLMINIKIENIDNYEK